LLHGLFTVSPRLNCNFAFPTCLMSDAALILRIDALLPQTQCGQCGYAGCKPYATAIADGEADINQCPPGGERGIHKLADLLGRAPKPLNPANGVEKPKALAFIDEETCIGCTLCIQACPVDAIVGAAKLMHTVIGERCTGCELCIAPCPVDCIAMIPLAEPETPEVWQRNADTAREHFEFRNARLAREKAEKAARLAAKVGATAEPAPMPVGEQSAEDKKRALIAAAMARAKAQREALQQREGQGPDKA